MSGPVQKKVCLLGAFAVGKTSLVARHVSGVFSEKYLTTIGVKIDRKDVDVDGRPVRLVLWDIHGEDAFASIRPSYLRGAAGLLLVADCTRAETLEVAMRLGGESAPGIPKVLAVNKVDLVSDREVGEAALDELESSGWRVVRTSAKSGRGVAEAFELLTRAMLGPA